MHIYNFARSRGVCTIFVIRLRTAIWPMEGRCPPPLIGVTLLGDIMTSGIQGGGAAPFLSPDGFHSADQPPRCRRWLIPVFSKPGVIPSSLIGGYLALLAYIQRVFGTTFSTPRHTSPPQTQSSPRGGGLTRRRGIRGDHVGVISWSRSGR